MLTLKNQFDEGKQDAIQTEPSFLFLHQKIRQNEALLARREVVTCRHRLKKPQVMTGWSTTQRQKIQAAVRENFIISYQKQVLQKMSWKYY